MDKDTVNNLINQNAVKNQYAQSPIAAHTHNGTDSMLVNILNLTISPNPNANVLFVYDSTDSRIKPVTIGSGLTYTHSTYTLTASSYTPSVTVRVYTASTTWTKPAGLAYAVIEVVGGGGKGCAGEATAGGAGGGGGGYSKLTLPAANLLSSETVTVGAGSTGSGGGTSSFGSHNSATGGTDAVNKLRPGGGGAGSGGDINCTGSPGILGQNSSASPDGTGGGGSSVLGGGNNFGTGQAYGGGGSGGTYGGGAGYNGGAGVVIVTEYY